MFSKYTLDTSSKKFICPNCGKKTFVKYNEVATGNYLADTLGRCDREVKCGYFNKPSGGGKKVNYIANYLNDKVYLDYNKYLQVASSASAADISKSYLFKWLYEAGSNYCLNRSLVQPNQYATIYGNLINTYGRYKVGVSSWFAGENNYYTYFPLIDTKNRLHYVQAKRFDQHGKTISGATKSWAQMYNAVPPHYDTQTYKIGALFGEHLIKRANPKDTAIVVVEAPKTALLLHYIYSLSPEKHTTPKASKLIFISCMSLGLFQRRLLRAIKPFNIVAIPDFDINSIALSKWYQIEGKLNQKGYKIDVLPLKGFKEHDNWDIADFICLLYTSPSPRDS